MAVVGEPVMTAAYREQGYVVARSLIPAALLDALSGRIERAVDAHAQSEHAAGRLPRLHADLPFARRLAALYAGTDFRLRSWDHIAFGPELFNLIASPPMAAALQHLLGEGAAFNGDYHLRPKLPSSEVTSFPWHQDSQYYGAPTQHVHIVTAWVPLIDVDEVNGCLYVIPGSHRWGLLDGARGEDQNMRTFEDVEARGAAVAVPMRRGDVLFFSNLTFHASKLNRSQDVRWSLDFRAWQEASTRVLSDAERAGYAHLRKQLANNGKGGFVYSGADGLPPSWSQWQHAVAALAALKGKG